MKFEELYNKKGEKRPYYLGEDGRNYFIYTDRTGYVIRDMCNDDIDNWLSVMGNNKKLSPVQIAIQKAFISQRIEKELDDNDSLERTMVVFNPSGQLIGSVDFIESEENDGKCKVTVYLKDEKLLESKGKRVLEVLVRMQNQEKLYDSLWMEDEKERQIRLA